MPLHLKALTHDYENPEILVWILKYGLNDADSIFCSNDNKYLHIKYKLKDRTLGDYIGNIVYTLKIKEKEVEILDADIIFNNDNLTQIEFIKLENGSSDANEYYIAEVIGKDRRFTLETVNRHVIDEELIDTVRNVSISAFPFKLSVYENMDEFNSRAGFKNPVRVGDTDYEIDGFSSTFIMPGAIMLTNSEDEDNFSFMLGHVISYRDIEVEFGCHIAKFVLAQVDTGVGVIPVAMNREIFELENLKENCVIGMYASVKVDLSSEKDFTDRNTNKPVQKKSKLNNFISLIKRKITNK